MTNSTLQTSIQSALQAFAPLSPAEGPATPLREAALSLLDTLGYRSDKTIARQINRAFNRS